MLDAPVIITLSPLDTKPVSKAFSIAYWNSSSAEFFFSAYTGNTFHARFNWRQAFSSTVRAMIGHAG